MNERQSNRGWSGLWRERYKQKALAVNQAVDELLNAGDSQSLGQRIEASIRQENSGLYRALNQHTSFFFKFTLTSLSFDTQAIINLKQTLRSAG